MNADLGAADLDQTLAEVDLQLSARRRLEPRRRQRLGLLRLTVTLHRPLQRSPADRQPLLGQQVLAHHIRIAAMPNEPLAQPALKAVEPFCPLSRLKGFTPSAAT
ncbi:hypothetical protein MesoLjLb_14870 [Mesorhizobium sp. L-8-3]|nr:hypothetical protein MesoLjLb_14870 [Mesorhizobium sp. L-8-3]